MLRELVVRDMKLRYKRSYLGLGWTLVNPLSQLLVYDFVFTVLFRVNTPNFSTFLFIGIVSWNWFATGLMQATTAILDNRDLIRQPGFPAEMLPVVTVTSQLIHFLLTLPVLFTLLVISDIPVTAAALWMFLIIALQFALTLSYSYLVAYLHVTFRDTQYLLGIFLMLGFFMTPILYSMELVPEAYLAIYRYNPMAHLIEAYRVVLMHGQSPDLITLAMVAGATLAQLVVFYLLFRRASTRFAEEI